MGNQNLISILNFSSETFALGIAISFTESAIKGFILGAIGVFLAKRIGKKNKIS
jgi:hypothetical protein